MDRKVHRVRVGLIRCGCAAFSLVELLVVIAIIMVLAGLLFSALARAKAKALAIQCLNNERNLTIASLSYLDDHDDYFPYNYGYAETEESVDNEKYWNWANNLLNWEVESYNTNTALLNAGGLGPYIGGAVGIYRCPSDFVLSDLQKDVGWVNRVRSYSMNAMVGNPGKFAIGGVNTNNPGYRQFFKSTQIPDPSRIFLFIEEHPDSINDGYFLNRIDSFEWNDLPASYHDGAAFISFCDGHVERHQWQLPSTQPHARPHAAHLPFPPPADEMGDFQWLMDHTSVKTR